MPCSGLRGTEATALLEGLDRENTLLRQQLTRSAARERALQLDTDELRIQLEAQALQDLHGLESKSAIMAAEGTHLREELERQGELAETVSAQVEELQRAQEAKDATILALRSQVATAHADIEAVACELERLQHFLLPATPAEEPSRTVSLEQAVRRAAQATDRLRLACRAKFQAYGMVNEQLRGRLESRVRESPRSDRSVSTGTAPVTGSAAGLQPLAEPSANLLAELHEAEDIAERDRLAAADASQRAADADVERLHVARDLEATRHTLRVREAEIRQLHILGKYFAGRPSPKLDVAEIAEELRERCAELTAEVERIRIERDLLRAERGCGLERGCWLEPVSQARLHR